MISHIFFNIVDKNFSNLLIFLYFLLLFVNNLCCPAQLGQESICPQCGRPGFNSWVGSSPGEESGNPLQYFAWRIPWTEEPDRLQFIHSRVGHDLVLSFFPFLCCPQEIITTIASNLTCISVDNIKEEIHSYSFQILYERNFLV